jgi:hypothetical protein
MGYDLSVRFRSKALRDAMDDFLSSQSSLFQAHAKALLLIYDTSSQPVRGEDLGAYVPGNRPRRMGYPVNVAQDWHWAVLVWMAQRSQDLDAKGHPGVWYDNKRFPLTPPASTQEGVHVDPRGHFIEEGQGWPSTPPVVVVAGIRR